MVDKDLQEWILPDFSTTTLSDTIICSVLMMSTLKTYVHLIRRYHRTPLKYFLFISYFNYKILLRCGIPSVTLEGEKSDWERLLTRLDKLESFGEEPKMWAALLRPIFTRFVRAFDGEPDVEFWGQVCHYHPQGSGPTYLSGWITAFCVWSSEGKWQGPSPSKPPRTIWLLGGGTLPELVLDKVSYPVIESGDVPVGFCEVDVKLDDNGEIFPCMMVSGHLAHSVKGGKKDTVRPIPAWFMFVKGERQTTNYITHKKAPTITQDKGKNKDQEKKTRNWKFWNM